MSTELNKVEPYNLPYFSQNTFSLQVTVAPLNIALHEIILPKINRQGVGIRMSWVEQF